MQDLWPYLGLILSRTAEWLQEPATQVAVLAPFAVALFVFIREGLTRKELGFMAAMAVFSSVTSRLVEEGGALQLLNGPWFSGAILCLTCLRWYLPSPTKVYAMVWFVMLASDFGGMLLWAQPRHAVQLPLGIGGAGMGDALFIEPLMVACGIFALKLARERVKPDALSRHVSRLVTLKGDQVDQVGGGTFFGQEPAFR